MVATLLVLLDGYSPVVRLLLLVRQIVQYKNLMPTVVQPGIPAPKRDITTITFEYKLCRNLTAADTKLRVSKAESGDFELAIETIQRPDCFGLVQKKQLELGTHEIPVGATIRIKNPAMVERGQDLH